MGQGGLAIGGLEQDDLIEGLLHQLATDAHGARLRCSSRYA